MSNSSASVPKAIPKAEPVPTPTTQPFWDAARQGELHLQHCVKCNQHVFYPRPHCPQCGSTELVWERASGRGRLYSYVINHVAPPGWAGDVPYVLAVVQLEEGPRMLSNLIGVAPDPEKLPLDMELEVSFVERGAQKLPVFGPVGSAA